MAFSGRASGREELAGEGQEGIFRAWLVGSESCPDPAGRAVRGVKVFLGESGRRSAILRQAPVELAAQTAGNMLSVVAAAVGGLEVAPVEGVEEVERQHGHQGEDQDGGGVVFVDVVGGPSGPVFCGGHKVFRESCFLSGTCFRRGACWTGSHGREHSQEEA